MILSAAMGSAYRAAADAENARAQCALGAHTWVLRATPDQLKRWWFTCRWCDARTRPTPEGRPHYPPLPDTTGMDPFTAAVTRAEWWGMFDTRSKT